MRKWNSFFLLFCLVVGLKGETGLLFNWIFCNFEFLKRINRHLNLKTQIKIILYRPQFTCITQFIWTKWLSNRCVLKQIWKLELMWWRRFLLPFFHDDTWPMIWGFNVLKLNLISISAPLTAQFEFIWLKLVTAFF